MFRSRHPDNKLSGLPRLLCTNLQPGCVCAHQNASKVRIDSRGRACYCPGPMKSVRLILLVVLALFVLYVKVSTNGTSGPALAPSAPSESWSQAGQQVPDKAVKVL